MSSKRPHIEIDPDYEDVSEVQNKRRRVQEEGAKQATKRRIERIIEKQFNMEVTNKESELLTITERLEMGKSVMDRLRACIVANYFGNASQQKAQRNSDQGPLIHPSVRRYIGKAPPGTPLLTADEIKKEAPEGVPRENVEYLSERIGKMATKTRNKASEATSANGDETDTRTGRFKVKRRIIVGNVSKSIPADQRDENDQATHKWMVYVRGPKNNPRINNFVKKVWFFLHPSYRPNDLVEVSEPPFHLTRRGWGEFPVRVQLHFCDHRNKRLDVIHNLKLDRTYTGLQTLGSETVVDVEIEKEVKPSSRSSCAPSIKQELSDNDVELQDATLSCTIKTEPPDDQEYGQIKLTEKINGDINEGTENLASVDCKSMEKSPMLANMLISASSGYAKAAPIQTIVNQNVISSQPLTLIPVGPPVPQNSGLLRVAPVTPTKDKVICLPVNSPGSNPQVPSPTRNMVLKGFSSITSPVLVDNKKNIQVNFAKTSNPASSLITVSPIKNANSRSVNFAMPQHLILSNNNKGNQLGIQTGLQVAGQQVKVNSPGQVNQSVNSGLIFLKCTDNQGKTFLIPQQVCSSVQTSTMKQNTLTSCQLKTTMSNSQPLILASSLPNMVTSAFISPQNNQIIHTTLKSVKTNELTSPGKPIVQNGPVLFIKPDNNSAAKKVTSIIQTKTTLASADSNPVKMTSTGNVQIVRNNSPSQSSNALNIKSTGNQDVLNAGNQVVSAGNQIVNAGNQSLLRGQLKVTSQGLIHIQGQKSKSNQNNVSDQPCLQVNGGVTKHVPSNSPRQPYILVPASINNNKMTVLPSKGKSLLSNLSVGRSNGNVIVLNQANAIQGTGAGVGKLVLTSPPQLNKSDSNLSTSQNRISSQSDMNVTQTKHLKTLPSNHIVIVPVTSQQTVTMTTKGQGDINSKVTDKNRSTFVNSKTTSGNPTDTKSNDKPVLIVVQNDMSKNSCSPAVNENSRVQRSMSSLLGSRSGSPIVSMAMGSEAGVPVTISSSDRKKKQVIVLNETQPVQVSQEKEKKIIVLEPKRRKTNKLFEAPEIIMPLCCRDYTDLRSLIRAAVLRHPVVSVTHGRQLHPYCAKSREEWLSWNIGKRRASEWQRASTVRRYVLSYLNGEESFYGEKMWSVKQILTWCRLHAYSPHYLEKPLHPTSIDLQAETSLGSGKHHKTFSSLTHSAHVLQEVTSLEQEVTSLDLSDDDIDIISNAVKKKTHKREVIEEVNSSDTELLPTMPGSIFVEEMAQQIGVKLVPTEVCPGYYGDVAHGTIYKAMESFMEDILRSTFALQVNMGRYPDTLGVADIFKALNNLPIADFLTNMHLGVQENQSSSITDR